MWVIFMISSKLRSHERRRGELGWDCYVAPKDIESKKDRFVDL